MSAALTSPMSPALTRVVGKLREIETHDPDMISTLHTLAEFVLERYQPPKQNKRAQTLIVKLRAVHSCPVDPAAGFEQLPAIGHVKEWRCQGCRQIVTLPKVDGR